MATPDWKGFRKKLADGKTVTQAAEEMGIDEAVADQYCKDFLSGVDKAPVSLDALAADALAVGVRELKDVLKQDGVLYEDRINAAKALVKMASDAYKMAAQARRTPKGTPAAGERDLFDVAGDWQLKKPGV